MSAERKTDPTPRPAPPDEPDEVVGKDAATHSGVEKVEPASGATAPSAEVEPDAERQAVEETRAIREIAKHADEEGVAALLKIAEDAIEDERSRGRALDAKTGQMLGFGGIVLSLSAAVVKPLSEVDLGRFELSVKALFALAVGALLSAVLLAFWGVLRPQEYRGIGLPQVREFNTPESQTMSRLVVHQRMLGALTDMLNQNRRLNNGKADITKVVGALLAVGFSAVALQAGLVGISQIGADTSDCVRRTAQTSTATGTTTTTVTTCS